MSVQTIAIAWYDWIQPTCHSYQDTTHDVVLIEYPQQIQNALLLHSTGHVAPLYQPSLSK